MNLNEPLQEPRHPVDEYNTRWVLIDFFKKLSGFVIVVGGFCCWCGMSCWVTGLCLGGSGYRGDACEIVLTCLSPLFWLMQMIERII